MKLLGLVIIFLSVSVPSNARGQRHGTFDNVVPRHTAQPALARDALALALRMQTEQVPVGQMPCAVLIVYNITDQPVIIRDTVYRVYVYGKDGEAPTTLLQRQLTGRLRPGEMPLSFTANVKTQSETLWPAGGAGDWFDYKFQLAYLYDLSVPGSYTSYAEVMDPSSQRWSRSKTVTFKVMARAE